MATVRYLVNDVDASLLFYRAFGFKLAERRGPPFAIVRRKGLSLWLSGPGTWAAKKLSAVARVLSPRAVLPSTSMTARRAGA